VDATRSSARGVRATALCCAVCAVLSTTTAAAATASFGVGAERSDNIARTATNEQTETTATANAAFGLELERPRLTGTVDANGQYRKYLDNSFNDEVVGGANVDLSAALIRERFDWILQDNFGQVARDRLVVETPDNRQNFNVFSTGPVITLPLGARTSLRVTGLWTDANYEDSVQNSESLDGTVALVRQLAEKTELSLVGSANETDYDGDPAFQTYRIKSAYLRLDTTGGRTTLSVDGGYTEATHGDESNSGPLVHLNITRRVGAYSTLGLTAGSEFQDTASQFRLDQTQLGVQTNNQDAVVAGDVFRSDFVFLSFGTERDRTSFRVGLSGSKERHEEQKALDRDIVRASLVIGRRMTQRLDLDLHGEYLDEDFVGPGPGSIAFHEWSVGVGMAMRLTENISMQFRVDRYDGSGDGTSRDYEENRASISFGYSTGRR